MAVAFSLVRAVSCAREEYDFTLLVRFERLVGDCACLDFWQEATERL